MNKGLSDLSKRDYQEYLNNLIDVGDEISMISNSPYSEPTKSDMVNLVFNELEKRDKKIEI